MGKKTTATEPTKARVLFDCPLGKANDVVTLSPEDLEAAGDQVDADPAAVAYAESLATPATEGAA